MQPFHPERRSMLISATSIAVFMAVPTMVAAQLRTPLTGLLRFVGHWRGEGDGDPGHSTVERSYELALDGKFLCARNKSTYLPQPKNPKGEVHQDIGFYSFDDARNQAVFRQFHSEGFVNQYISAAANLSSNEIKFESEQLENIPAGYKAKETYRFSGNDRFEELFEVAKPGGQFQVYSHNSLHRI